jgi:hypothetical protein
VINTAEPEVERYFKQFGKVVDVAIMRDKHTGRSRGFAFVTFEVFGNDAVASLKQILLHPLTPHCIGDRKIEVREGDGNKPADSFLGKQQPATATTGVQSAGA